ncbi:hypothetical protein ABZP36_029813 [Zizania latifolia]
MPERNAVSWNTMVNGYVQAGDGREALGLFTQMQAEGVRPDDTVLVGVLVACVQLGVLEQGKWVHDYLKANDIRITVFLVMALVDMYAKCGEVSSQMTSPSLVHCAHAHTGFVDKGQELFNSMDGTLALHVMSEPIPEVNDQPVKTVVTDSLRKVVFNSGNNVLLEFYVPWCGHCQKLAPILDEVAVLLKDNEDVVVAKMVMVGVDRLDMIKGIPQKILAFEKFLEENPDWNDNVVLLQIIVSTRNDVPECMSPFSVLSPIYTLCDSTSISAGVPRMHEV